MFEVLIRMAIRTKGVSGELKNRYSQPGLLAFATVPCPP